MQIKLYMKKILLTILIAAFSGQLFAQTALPANCSVWLPKKLDVQVIRKTDASAITKDPYYGQNPAPAHKHYWVVYSDRDNNPTYDAPKSGARQFSKLAFNERLIIAKIQSGYALVYTEPKNERYPLISSAAVSKGWVKLDNLLLWNKGLADDADISYKAVICANLNTASNEAEGKLYKSPTSQTPVGGLTANMQFYFIMKEVGNRALLARYASLPNGNTGLYGWVDKNSYVPWNHRTCLEPTWDRSNVEWFAANNKMWQVFQNKDKLTGTAPAQSKFTKTPSNITGPYAAEYYYRTMSRSRLRYPILKGSTKDLYHISSFAAFGQAGQSTPSDTQIDADLAAAIANLKNTKNIRIGILIDGTASMKNYFTSAQKAIIEGCKYFDADQNVQVAVAIYRDKEDGQYLFESYPAAGFTTSSNPGLRNFLSTAGVYGAKSKDTDAKEALYYGISTAIDKFNFNPKESNLLLIVGDCGDNGKMGITREAVIKKLADKNINVMGFQVRNKQGDAFQSFNTQLTYIMRQSLITRFANKANYAGITNTAEVVGTELTDGSGWDIYNKNKSSKDQDLYRYVARRKHLNGEMEIDELAKLMEKTISDWDKQIQYLTSVATKLLDFETTVEGDGTITAALIDMIGKERYGRLKNRKALISFRGWTLKKDPTSKRDLWKTVVFFPAPELKVLVTKLKPVYDVARSKSNDRRPYIEAMSKLAATLMAQDLSGVDVKKLPYKKIIAEVFGLDDATTDLGGPSLEDIGDPNVISHQQYLNYCNKMANSYTKLQKMLATDYPFIYEVLASQDKYYWLPGSDLPL